MPDYNQKINDIINDITHNKATYDQVKERIGQLEKEYGPRIFPGLSFEKEDKKSWNKQYFSKLKLMSISGASSKEFILHMAEVNDYINTKTRNTIIAAAIAVVAVIVVLIIIL